MNSMAQPAAGGDTTLPEAVSRAKQVHAEAVQACVISSFRDLFSTSGLVEIVRG